MLSADAASDGNVEKCLSVGAEPRFVLVLHFTSNKAYEWKMTTISVRLGGVAGVIIAVNPVE